MDLGIGSGEPILKSTARLSALVTLAGRRLRMNGAVSDALCGIFRERLDIRIAGEGFLREADEGGAGVVEVFVGGAGLTAGGVEGAELELVATVAEDQVDVAVGVGGGAQAEDDAGVEDARLGGVEVVRVVVEENGGEAVGEGGRSTGRWRGGGSRRASGGRGRSSRAAGRGTWRRCGTSRRAGDRRCARRGRRGTRLDPGAVRVTARGGERRQRAAPTTAPASLIN